MKRILLLFSLIIGITTVQAQAWKIFTESDGNYTARYPDDWENTVDEAGRVFFKSPLAKESYDFRQNVNMSITFSESLVNTKLRAVVPDLLKAQETKYEGYKFLNGKYFMWNGTEAYEYDYSIKQADLSFNVRITQWMCIKDGSIYMLTHTAPVGPDVMRENAVKIMKSIVF